MCLALYIATSVELPSCEWDPVAPAFYLSPLDRGDPYRRRFSLPHVYYAGAHQGCSCGFRKDGETGEDLQRCQANFDALAVCLSQAQQEGAKLELFYCWAGGQSDPTEYDDELTIGDIADPAFEFKEQQHIRILR